MSKKHKNIFFMEILNDILKINDTNVIIIYDTDGNIWFGLKDIIKSLGYSNIQKAMANIKTSINNKKLYSNLYPTPTGEGSLYNINKDILKPSIANTAGYSTRCRHKMPPQYATTDGKP